MSEVMEQCCCDDSTRVRTAAVESYATLAERDCIDVNRPVRVFLDMAKQALDVTLRATCAAGIARLARRGHPESVQVTGFYVQP